MRILLVEDDPTTARSIELMLNHANFNVYLTDMGEEGVDLAKLYDYDLILLDLKMPQMTGWAFRLELEHDPALAAVPVVVCSGAFDAKAEAASLGAVDHLRKPVDPARLCSIVQRYCREPMA